MPVSSQYASFAGFSGIACCRCEIVMICPSTVHTLIVSAVCWQFTAFSRPIKPLSVSSSVLKYHPSGNTQIYAPIETICFSPAVSVTPYMAGSMDRPL